VDLALCANVLLEEARHVGSEFQPALPVLVRFPAQMLAIERLFELRS